jgi:hypothetical protein
MKRKAKVRGAGLLKRPGLFWHDAIKRVMKLKLPHSRCSVATRLPRKPHHGLLGMPDKMNCRRALKKKSRLREIQTLQMR